MIAFAISSLFIARIILGIAAAFSAWNAYRIFKTAGPLFRPHLVFIMMWAGFLSCAIVSYAFGWPLWGFGAILRQFLNIATTMVISAWGLLAYRLRRGIQLP